MKNWLGQEIEVDDYVGCGRRDGNSTLHRLGRVTGFDETKRTANVEWLYEPWGADSGGGDPWISVQTFTGRASIGNPGIDTLFVLDINSFASRLSQQLIGKSS